MEGVMEEGMNDSAKQAVERGRKVFDLVSAALAGAGLMAHVLESPPLGWLCLGSAVVAFFVSWVLPALIDN